MFPPSLRPMKHALILLVLSAFVLALLPVQEVEARKGFGGFGRSSFGRSSFGFGRRSTFSGRRTSFWGRSSSRAKSSRGWSGGNMSRRVGTKGNVFSSRSQAQRAYRNNLKTTWKSKPATRPAYVPRRYSSGGRNYDVVFRNGRYGYWGPGNTWVALAAGSMLVSGALMANRGYYYGTPYSRGSGGGGVPLFFIFLAVFFFVSFVGNKARRMR